MDYDTICGRIRDYLTTNFPNPALTLSDETSLLDGWFVDSMGIVQVVIFLEDEFGCEVRAADVNAENFATVSTLAQFVTERTGVGCG